MRWTVIQCVEFQEEFEQFPGGLQDELLAYEEVLAQRGPGLGRPLVDTLKGSHLSNLKELRFSWQRQPYRFLFAFDPERAAVVLIGGSKAGDKQFYERAIPLAEQRYERHLDERKKRQGENHEPHS